MSVENVLDSLGIEYEDVVGEYLARCPRHFERTGKYDNNPSWYINAESGLHICFSCGYKGNLVSLVADLREIDYGQAQAWVVEGRSDLDSQSIRNRLTKATSWKVVREPDYLPESSLARFDFPPAWALEARLLRPEAVFEHQVMWNDGSWILPIRDAFTSLLLGWQVKGQVTRSFVRNHPKGIPASRTLFGLHMVQSSRSTIWVVESPLDAVRLFGLGIESVATFGSSVSPSQVGLMSAFDRVVLAFDNPDIDVAGAKATKSVLERARQMGMDVCLAQYPEGCKDPGDCTDDQLLAIEPKHYVRK